MGLLDRIFNKHHHDEDEDPVDEDQTTQDFEESRAEKKKALDTLRTSTQRLKAVAPDEETNPGIPVDGLRHAEG